MSDFETLREEGFSALRRGRFDDAEEVFRRALAAAVTDADRELGRIYVAAVPVFRGDRDASLNVFRESLMRRRSARHAYAASYYLLIYDSLHGSAEDGARWTAALLDAANALDEPRTFVTAYDLAATVESQRGNHVAALEYNRASLAMLERCSANEETALMNAVTRHNIAYNALAGNDFAAALPYAVDAVTHAEALDNPPLLRQCIVTAAIALMMRDRLGEAETMIARLERGSHFDRYVPYVLGECARRRGDRRSAAAHFRELEAFYPDIPSLAEILLSYNIAPFLMPD